MQRRINLRAGWHGAIAACTVLGLLGAVQGAYAKFSSTLQGQSQGSTNWIGSNLSGWQDLDYIPMRVYVTGGPASGEGIQVYFEHFHSGKPGFEDLTAFITSSNVVFTSGPTLVAPAGSDTWYYDFTINLTDKSPGYVQFLGRLSAGAHLNTGASLHLGGTPSLSTLQIFKAAQASGSPDLALQKHGPAQALPRTLVTYTIDYTNSLTAATGATGAQVTDFLPPTVTYVANSGGSNATLVGNTLFWDLGNLARGAYGSVTFQALVNSNAANGQTITNSAQIYSEETDANYGDNFSQVITSVVFNRAPVANNDAYAANEDTLLSVAAAGVLANDTDVDGNPLTAILASGPAHGTLTLNADGSFRYLGAPNFNGTDSFTYRANDGTTNSLPATVTITVLPVNDAPVAMNDAYTINEDTVLTIDAPGVLANDTDVDEDHLSAVLMDLPAHGSLSFLANGGFVYTPTANYNGTDTFTYRASDGQAQSGVATVTITILPVNDAPVAVNDAYTVNEDTLLAVAAPGVLANDTDVDGDHLTAILVTAPAHGTLTFNPDGSFHYLGATNFNGTDTFTYKANDGALDSPPVTVSIVVQPVDDPPVAQDIAYTVNEDAVLSIPAPGVLAVDSDVDGHPLLALLVAGFRRGNLVWSESGGFVYTPNPDFNGVDTLTYRARGGTLDSGLATVTITVIPVNDPPSFTKGPDQLVNQDTGAQSIANWATSLSAGPPDEAGQTLSFVVNNDTNALFSVQPAISPAGTLTYTPAPNAYGVAHVTVVLKDDGGTANGGNDTSAPQTFTITVNAPPTVGIIEPTNQTIFIAPANITIIAEAQDVDGTISEARILQGTNVLLQTNTAPYLTTWTNVMAGTYQFIAQATDNLGATGTSSPVNVTVLERPPLQVIQTPRFNPQTGLFEEIVRVFNPTPVTLTAVRVLASNLATGVKVFNASGTTNGVAYAQFNQSILPGGSGDLTIEFYAAVYQTPTPTLAAEVTGTSVSGASVGVSYVPVTRQVRLPNGQFLLEFSSLAGRIYFVQYSADIKSWQTAWPSVLGTSNRIQWLDNGPPRTESSPVGQPCRFYRVVLAP